MTQEERATLERLEDKLDKRFDEMIAAYKEHARNDREDFGKLDDRMRAVEKVAYLASALGALAITAMSGLAYHFVIR